MAINDSFKKIGKITWYEIKKSRSATKKKIVYITLILATLIYLTTMVLLKSGFSHDETFYTVFTENPEIKKILLENDKFLIVPDAEADIIVEVSDEIHIFSSGTDRSRAALYTFEKTIKDYNKRIAEQYPYDLAYPLRVDLEMIEREDLMLQAYMDSLPAQDSQEDQSESINRQSNRENTQRQESASETGGDPSETESIEKEPNDKSQDQDILSDNEFDLNIDTESTVDMVIEEIGDGNSNEGLSLPENLNPFNQLKTLFMVIFLTIPVSMIAVVYANSIMSEKMNKRGVFFLLAPVKRYEFIIGKTIPYLAGSFVTAIAIMLSSSRDLSVLLKSSGVLFSIFIIYLGIGFLSAMLSRSHRELSFLGIFFISLFTCYLLIPSFMVNISFLSMASPLSLIVKIFQHEAITLKLYLFMIVPTLLAGVAMYYFGSKLLNDEDMFSYRTIKEKIIDSLSFILKRVWMLAVISFFSVPFVFLAELIMMVFLLSLGAGTTSILFVFIAALIEELFRNMGVYTILRKKLHKKKTKHLLWYAFLAGLGFFLAEKGLFLLMIAPFLRAYSSLNLSGGLQLLIPTLFGFVFVVLLIHTVLTFIFALSVKKFKNFTTPLMITTTLHFIINMATNILITAGF
ncbi:MAG: hypothetical protein ACLFPQ_01940 [Candidatus Woesearchaeota archaeon]